MDRYTLKELKAMPVLCEGQAEDLRFEDSNFQVWLSRCGAEDGEPYANKVTVYCHINGRWKQVDQYKAEGEEKNPNLERDDYELDDEPYEYYFPELDPKLRKE